jgi:phosphoribosyl-ATP pyrophosphohydrolase
MNTLNELYTILKDRKTANPAQSYTARLFQEGEDEIIKKIGEEAIEVILAAKGQGEARIIEEISDLVYHTMVLMVAKDISLAQVSDELEKRRK